MNPLCAIGPISFAGLCALATGQNVVSFDFDNAPVYAALPIDVVAGGITAHLSATGQGYSIQSTSTAPVVPIGFSGHFVYPSSVYPADLIVAFSRTLTGFSILYSPQELGCDDSARMRVTAYMNNVLVGTNTMTATMPGTWPVETLSCAFAQGFNRVVVHYDAPPPTCQDHGPIFLADNMTATVAPFGAYVPFGTGCTGSGGMPALTPAGPPAIGQVSVLTVQNPPVNFVVGLGVLGFSNTTWQGSPLPAELTSLGMPSCWLGIAPESLWLFTQQAGLAQWSYLLPADPGLVGLHFYVQALLVDPLVPDPANTLMAVMTNSLAGVIGY
ncbi:MAG TPA: hypothetical protein VFZ65_05630 [Planctomycetota bacterium]|nr:hypothetical protein [Planctomycetota bacterium]